MKANIIKNRRTGRKIVRRIRRITWREMLRRGKQAQEARRQAARARKADLYVSGWRTNNNPQIGAARPAPEAIIGKTDTAYCTLHVKKDGTFVYGSATTLVKAIEEKCGINGHVFVMEMNDNGDWRIRKDTALNNAHNDHIEAGNGAIERRNVQGASKLSRYDDEETFHILEAGIAPIVAEVRNGEWDDYCSENETSKPSLTKNTALAWCWLNRHTNKQLAFGIAAHTHKLHTRNSTVNWMANLGLHADREYNGGNYVF